MKPIEWIVLLAIVLMVVLIAASGSGTASDCAAKGKVLVRGVSGYECVSK